MSVRFVDVGHMATRDQIFL